MSWIDIRNPFTRFIVAVAVIGSSGFAFAADDVVIYSSIDEPVLTPLIKRFEEKSGKHVRVVTDTEATKSAGLAERIEAEMDRPQADVYWNNEFVHTIRLAERGAFASYRPDVAADVPAAFSDKQNRFVPIGLRARMIVVSTRPEFHDLVANIHGVNDLVDPKLKGKVGVCNPAVGTASAQFSALRLVMGDEKFAKLLAGLKANDIALLGGNSVVAEQVAKGNLAAGLTDNDDIANAKSEGSEVEAIVPDQSADAIGTLVIPTTISLIKNAPHERAAKQLIDFLCDPAIERDLIDGKFLAYSFRDSAKVRAMNVDMVECSKQMRPTIEMALKVFQLR